MMQNNNYDGNGGNVDVKDVNYLSPNSNGAQQTIDDTKMSISPEFQQQQQQPQQGQQSQPQQTQQAQQQQQQQQTKITFVIQNFSTYDNQFYTSTNSLWELTWRLYVFPKGNTSPQDLSLFLDMAEIKQANFPNQKVNFILELVNQKNPEENVRKTADHIFNVRSADWGFNKFMKLSVLLDPKNGFIVNDTVIIHAHILMVIPEVVHANGQRTFMYNSKKATGFVGLKNQGATCYMNSLLQALYQISPFRKAVYELPTSQTEESIPLALQRLFYKLQFGNVAVSTKELTKSFGWGTHDIFTQHDVQELNRVLCDNLNEKMKGTKAEGTIDNLFRGKIKNFIKCENVKYESKREEEFYDLSLNVKGCSTIYQSFEKYVEVERLDGSNKYDAEGFGLQDANKGCRFLSYPQVLHLQLKRFEYDPIRDANVKVNDRYTFPEVLDLSPYLDEDTDKSIPSVYHLQGVLVHSGDLHNGHYYAFLKPSMDSDWLKFDDEDVSKCTFTQVTEESYGSEVDPARRMPYVRNFTNAYMLIYLREKESVDLLKPIPDSDIPEHLKQRVESDEKKTNNQYFRIKLTTDEDFVNNPGFDLADFSKVQFQMIPLKPGEQYNIAYLKRQITTLVGIPPERQRIWSCFIRRNKTMRIDLLPEYDETSLAEVRDKFRQQEIRLYLEVSYIPRSLNMNEQNSYFQPITQNNTNGLIFFKYYNPQTTTMKFVGSKVIDLNWKAFHIIPILNQFAGLPQNTNLALYEELSESEIVPVKLSESLKKLEIQNGDIIVFQKPVSINEKYLYPTAAEYFDYIQHKTTVKFRQTESPVNFALELSKDMKYPEITNIISKQIKVDANKIRLLSGPKYYGNDFTPIKPNDKIPLKDILLSGQKATDILYFEVLSIPVSECESKRNFKVNWQKPNYEYEKVSIWVTKTGDVGDIKQTFVNVISEIMPDAPAMDVNKLKLLEIRSHRVDRELKDELVVQIMDNSNLKIEVISEEELNRSPSDKLVQVVHFSNENGFTSYHSTPFLMIIKEEESFAQIRTRIQSRFGASVSPNEFARWKVAIIQDDKPKMVNDETIISKGSDWSNVMLGLLHHPSINMKHNQKAIKINK